MASAVVKEELLELEEITEHAKPAMEADNDDEVEDRNSELEEMEIGEGTENNNCAAASLMQTQVKEIKEENDEMLYGEQFEQYQNTETADAFTVKLLSNKPISRVPPSTEGKQRSNVLSYDERGFQVCEFFPKGGVSNHILLIDGHRLYMNSKRLGTCMYKCMYRHKGCSARFKIHTNLILKVNEHNHSAVKGKEENWHYRCVYCRKRFTDLEERREHILHGNHDLPYKILESDCIFAEWNTSGVPHRDEFDEPNPIDKTDIPDDAINYPLPNAKHIKNRIFIDKHSFIFIADPSLSNVPVDCFPTPVLCTLTNRTLPRTHNQQPKTRASVGRGQTSKRSDTVTAGVTDTEKTSSGDAIKIRNSRSKKKEDDTISDHIDDVINSTDGKVIMYCDICDMRFKGIKQLNAHKASKFHEANRKSILQEEEKEKLALSFDKPIFTPEFLAYNKRMEAELRTLRKGAVELEEQNAVLTTHINEMNGVVDELNNAKQLMETRHEALEQHLKDLKQELSTVFSNVLAKEISSSNFNETFNKVSMAITGNSNSRMLSDLKKQLKTAHIDAVML